MKKDGKSKLEETVMKGVYGEPEIKKEEKNRFLGQFKERVIRYLTYEQIMQEKAYNEIREAVKSQEAKKLIIDRDVDNNYAHDYIQLAREHNIKFKRVDSPDFKGDVALVVVSDRAVNVKKGR